MEKLCDENELISISLIKMAQIREIVDQLRPLLSTFQVDMKQLKETSEYLGDCEKAANNLVNEHKTHTEELRLINQDINHLEDLNKGIRNSHSNQRVELYKKHQMFCRSIVILNQNIRDLKLPENHSINVDEIIEVPQWLKDFNDARSSFVISNNFPVFNFPRIFGENPHLIGRFSNLFRPHGVGTSFIGRTQEDPSKLKNCQFCGREIHRNAPVCPYCKQKSTSLRNPRRQKKRQS